MLILLVLSRELLPKPLLQVMAMVVIVNALNSVRAPLTLTFALTLLYVNVSSMESLELELLLTHKVNIFQMDLQLSPLSLQKQKPCLTTLGKLMKRLRAVAALHLLAASMTTPAE